MPGPHFVDGDAEFGEPMGPELRGHHDARFADAVLAAVDRGFGRAYRRNVDDHAAKLRVGLPLFDHPAGDKLREKIRAFEIDAHYAIEALFGRIEDVGPHAGARRRRCSPAHRAGRIARGLLSTIGLAIGGRSATSPWQ